MGKGKKKGKKERTNASLLIKASKRINFKSRLFFLKTYILDDNKRTLQLGIETQNIVYNMAANT